MIFDSKQSFFAWLFCDSAALLLFVAIITRSPGNLPLGFPATLFPDPLQQDFQFAWRRH